MSYYSKMYRIEFDNVENARITIDIYPKSFISPTPVTPNIVELVGTGLAISIMDNEEYKFNVIKAKKAEFGFISNQAINLITFATGDDDEFYVEIYNGPAQFIFKGFLVVGESSEDYENPPNVVKLTATDNLALLKDLPLTDFNGLNPKGMFPLIKFLAWALSKTGLNLGINVINNLREHHSLFQTKTSFFTGWPHPNSVLMPPSVTAHLYPGIQYIISGTQHNNGVFTVQSMTPPYVTFAEPVVAESAVLTTFKAAQYNILSSLFVDAKTFERAVGESESCYTVIQKILNESCILEQIGGEWWIKRVAEIRESTNNYVQFYPNGNYAGEGSTTMGFLISNDDPTNSKPYFLQGSTVFIEGKQQEIKEIYGYDYPKEIIDNINLDRGALISTVSSTEKRYALDDWNLKKGNPEAPQPATCQAYIKRTFNALGYEDERYLVLTNPSVATVVRSYVESNAIPVSHKDKFEFSVDFKFPNNITNGGAPLYVITAIRLKGEDGSNWWLGHDPGVSGVKWYQSNFNWGNFSFSPGPAIQLEFNGTIDTREWQTTTWEAPACPVSGKVYVQLCAMNSQSNNASTWDDTDIHYRNISFTYYPFINGSYEKYTGQYNKVSQNINTKKRTEADVYLSDSPKKLFKGALHRWNGLDYVLVGLMLDATLYPNGVDNEKKLHPYGWWQAFDVFFQFKRDVRAIDAIIQLANTNGLPKDIPNALQRIFIADNHVHAAAFYMLLHYDIDLDTCEWRGRIIENYPRRRTVFGLNDILTGQHEFKYLTDIK